MAKLKDIGSQNRGFLSGIKWPEIVVALSPSSEGLLWPEWSLYVGVQCCLMGVKHDSSCAVWGYLSGPKCPTQ